MQVLYESIDQGNQSISVEPDPATKNEKKRNDIITHATTDMMSIVVFIPQMLSLADSSRTQKPISSRMLLSTFMMS